MKTINPVLLKFAQQTAWKNARMMKQADGMPPGGGMPGAPMPGPAPAPAMAAPMAAPQAAPQGAGASGKPKFDPLMLDYRMYNMQQQLTAIMNALKIQLPPESIIMPPGTNGAPPAEAAIQGGPSAPPPPQDPAAAAAGGGDPAFPPIEPVSGFDGSGAGVPKAASYLDVLLAIDGKPDKLRSLFMAKKAAEAEREARDEKLAAEIAMWPIRSSSVADAAAAARLLIHHRSAA